MEFGFLVFIIFISYRPLVLILGFLFYLLFIVIYLRFIMNSYFYSYLLFLLFVSGLIVIFIYLCRVILNEKFTLINLLMLIVFIILFRFINFQFYVGIFDLNFNFRFFEFYNLLKFFIYSYNLFSLFFVLYLLFCLIVVYELIKKVKGPLRFNI